jgi:hypothetical protein
VVALQSFCALHGILFSFLASKYQNVITVSARFRLACELVSAIFLSIPGYSPQFQAALNAYLSTCANNPALNASVSQRKRLLAMLQAAVCEEDRRYFAREWRRGDADAESPGGPVGSDGNLGMLTELMECCTMVLQQRDSHGQQLTPKEGRPNGRAGNNGTTGAANADTLQRDLVFVFLVEVLYPTLVQQLRNLADTIIQGTGSGGATQASNGDVDGHSVALDAIPSDLQPTLPRQCKASYSAYLTARQLVGNLSGSGLARFSWASTIYPEDDDDLNSVPPTAPQGQTQSLSLQPPAQRAAAPDVTSRPTSAPHESREKKLTEHTPVKAPPARTSIGSYLLSQLSWPSSPAPPESTSPRLTTDGGASRTAAQVGNAVPESQQERLQQWMVRQTPSPDTEGESAGDSELPVAVSYGDLQVIGPTASAVSVAWSDSAKMSGKVPSASVELYNGSLDYSASPANQHALLSPLRVPSRAQAGLSVPLTAAEDTSKEPHSARPIMQRSGCDFSTVTPGSPAPQTPASTRSGQRGHLSSTGRRRQAVYDGRYGYRHTPTAKGQPGYTVVTPSRSVLSQHDGSPRYAHTVGTPQRSPQRTPQRNGQTSQLSRQPSPAPASPFRSPASAPAAATPQVEANTHRTKEPGSARSSVYDTPNRSSVRYREQLIISYVTSVKVRLYECARSILFHASNCAVLPHGIDLSLLAVSVVGAGD